MVPAHLHGQRVNIIYSPAGAITFPRIDWTTISFKNSLVSCWYSGRTCLSFYLGVPIDAILQLFKEGHACVRGTLANLICRQG